LAVGLIGDSEDRFSTMFVEARRVSRLKTSRAFRWAPARRAPSRRSKRLAQAAVLDPGGMIRRRKEGLNSLGSWRFVPLAVSGLRRHDKKIAENRGQIRRWVRAMMRSADVFARSSGGGGDIGLKNFSWATSSRHAHRRNQGLLRAHLLRVFPAYHRRKDQKYLGNTRFASQ